jgi:hypothetical protein
MTAVTKNKKINLGGPKQLYLTPESVQTFTLRA